MAHEGAGCIILSEATGALLLVRRSALVTRGLLWANPGGTRDAPDADLEVTALRETYEETLLLPGLHGQVDASVVAGFRYVTFVATVPLEVEPTLNWESDAAAWAPFNERTGRWLLPSPLHTAAGERGGFRATMQKPRVLAQLRRAIRA